jgi:hypothetical protein
MTVERMLTLRFSSTTLDYVPHRADIDTAAEGSSISHAFSAGVADILTGAPAADRGRAPWSRFQWVLRRGLVQLDGCWLAYYGQSDTTLAVTIFDPSEASYRANW